MEKQIVAMPSGSALLHDQTARAALDLAAEAVSSPGDCGGAKLAPPQSGATAARRGASGAE